MEDAARIQVLQTQIARLQERCAALEAALGADINPHVVLGLTGQEAAVFGLLMARGRASREQIMAALYGLRPDGEEAEIKIVDVFVCKTRKKLRRFGIEITTLWGQGYAISPEMREKARRFIVDAQP